MIPKLHIAFHTPLPEAVRTDDYDIDPNVTSVDVTTQLPGGFNTLLLKVTRLVEAGIYYPQFPRPSDILPRGHVTVHIGSFLLFEGTVTKRKWKGGEIVEVTVTGYGIAGLNDDWYKNNEVNVSSSVSQIQSTQKTAGNIIADAVASCAPLIVLGSEDEFIDPSTVYIPGSFYGQTPAQIIEAVTKIGNSLNLVWDYTVYEDRVLALRPRQLTGEPNYALPLDPTAEITEDFGALAGKARVEYTLPDWDMADKATLLPDHNGNYQTTDATNPDFFELYGFNRSVYLKGGELTAAIANQFRDTSLLVNLKPASSGQITRDKWRGMELASGGELPSYMTRAGDWVQVADFEPLIVVQTHWTNQAQMTCELGKTAEHWETLIAYLRETTRHIVMGTNPLTGARA